MTKHQNTIALASGDYLSVVKDFALSRGIQVSDLLEGSALDEAEFIHPPEMISNFLVNNIGSNLYKHLKEPMNEAVHYGLQVMSSSHGSLGMAIQSSACLREGLGILKKYYHTRLASQTPSIDTDENYVHITLNSTIEVQDHAKEVQRFFDLSTFVSMARIIRLALGKNTSDDAIQIHTDITRPPEFPAEQAPYCEFLFEAPCRCLSIPIKWLDMPFLSANERIKTAAIEQCEAELKQIEPSHLIERIRATLNGHSGTLPSIEAIAKEYYMSTATLKRKLSQLGSSYIDIKNEVRQTRAERALIETSLSVERISDELGFSDSSNFTKFFKKQTGVTPKQFRATNELKP